MSGFKKNFSPEYRETHYQHLIKMFAREVHVVTEWRDGCVYRTKSVGVVVAFMSQAPFKPGGHARI